MLLGHSTFSETTFANPRLDAIHNLAFGVTQSGLTFTIGTETVTGSAVFELSGNSISVSLGDETTLGESFQTLITLSTGSPNFIIWNEVDDTEVDSITWSEVFED